MVVRWWIDATDGTDGWDALVTVMKRSGMGGWREEKKGVSATRPKCVLNRLICHGLSSKEIKSVKSPCAHTVVSAGVRKLDCSWLCVRQCVMSVHVHLITTMNAHLGIHFAYKIKDATHNVNLSLHMHKHSFRKLCALWNSKYESSIVFLHYL